MPKECDRCQQSFKGFGTTCAACRRAPAEAAAASSPKVDGVAPGCCEACHKRVYAMDEKRVEGLLFHKTCFKCTACGCTLSGNFGKSELGFFCLTHFHQIAKVTGGYKTGTGPTRNAVAAGLVDRLVNRQGSIEAAPALDADPEELAMGEKEPVAQGNVALAKARLLATSTSVNKEEHLGGGANAEIPTLLTGTSPASPKACIISQVQESASPL